MKLLFCNKCGSVFSLAIQKMKSCDCGKVWGMYTDRRMAVTNGKGFAIGMGTDSLNQAIYRMAYEGEEHERKHYLETCPVVTWVRPNSGTGNPHTQTVEDKDVELD